MSSEPVRLSIIVPVHNNARDLRECLAALTYQCESDVELIVVDDASNDETPAVAAEFTTRVLRLAKNSGPATARNRGAGPPSRGSGSPSGSKLTDWAPPPPI